MERVSSRGIASHRLLLLDDNRNGLVARKTVLEEIGYRITASTTPSEALELVALEKFDLIITDFKMPGMDGTEFIRKARKHAAAVPIIMISGFTDAYGLTEETTGADLVIAKSAHEVAHMVRAVRGLLRKAAQKKPPASHRQPRLQRKKA